MSERDLDIVVWGATGFTGELAVAYLKGDATKFFSFALPGPGAPADLRWAVAGRNRDKLEKLGASEVIVCESEDEAAINRMVGRTKVVVGFAGPFIKYSDRVVAACARLGTHWVDITGEVAWHRSLIDRFGDRARATGACIVPHCGYDSIPSDLGAFYAVHALRSRHSNAALSVRSVVNYQLMQGGGFSGGSLQTGLAGETHPVILTAGVDTNDNFLLGGETRAGVREEDREATKAYFSDELNAWIAPFTMGTINTRVVRRTSAILNFGEEFNYQEVGIMPSEKQALKAARLAVSPAPPEAIKSMIKAGKLPGPGQGPPPQVRAKARFTALLVARGVGGEEAAVSVSGGEAGYEETAKMAIEAGLALACEGSKCPGVVNGGGFLTPATAMGHVLINRLHRAGIKFEVLATAGTSAAPQARALVASRMNGPAKL